MGADMEDRNGAVVVYRLSWVAGAAGISLALFRLERLLRSTTDGPPWEFVLIAAVLLGAAITWAGFLYRLGSATVIAINVVAMALTVVRVTVPHTTWFLLPTGSSFAQLGTELALARDVIRTGAAPVLPIAGLVALLAVVFWALGAVAAWGLLRNRPYLAVLSPLGFYLYLATVDRRPSGISWTTSFLLVLGGALLAVVLDRRGEGAGRLSLKGSWVAIERSVPSLPALALATTLIATVVASGVMADLVPATGVLDWRYSTGLGGEYFGGVSYNPFVGIRQSLVSPDDVPVFVAEVEGDVPHGQLYWRLLTLETFNGNQWFTDPNRSTIQHPEGLENYEAPIHAFTGPTAQVTQDITILALQMDWLPAVYSPTEMTSDNRVVHGGFRVKEDGSLRFDALSFRGMTYRVTSEVPQPDLSVLSAGADGELSVLFSEAARDGLFATEAGTDPALRPFPEDIGRFLRLPEDLDTGIALLARDQTRGLTTDFERALALESYFRDRRQFTYDVDIEPGHGAKDLGAWLLDPESPNFHRGYCEQFATSMAVMARTLGIPSRVVLGFTPGERLNDGTIVVRDRNSHAWVELWMPTQGWVRFDPTPRSDRINPATIESIPFEVTPYLEVQQQSTPADIGGVAAAGSRLFTEDLLADQARLLGQGGDSERRAPGLPSLMVPLALVAIAIAGAIPALKGWRRRRRLRRLEAGDISAAWMEIVDRLSDLGAPPHPALTPNELADLTTTAMRPLAHVYGRTAYGPPEPVEGAQVAIAARALRETESTLASNYSRSRRLLAWYRIGTLLPDWLRRRLEGHAGSGGRP
ncbi:MAG: DUF3488 and DUF4129 domain-containing transglutaminase family protein [Acidimicrobiia bacterium]